MMRPTHECIVLLKGADLPFGLVVMKQELRSRERVIFIGCDSGGQTAGSSLAPVLVVQQAGTQSHTQTHSHPHTYTHVCEHCACDYTDTNPIETKRHVFQGCLSLLAKPRRILCSSHLKIWNFLTERSSFFQVRGGATDGACAEWSYHFRYENKL